MTIGLFDVNCALGIPRHIVDKSQPQLLDKEYKVNQGSQ